jgi:hypothetical protein
MALEMVLRRMGVDGATVHSLRSAFRDWAGNETHPSRACRICARSCHRRQSGADLPRSDALARRQQLMDAWSRFCDDIAGEKVLAFKGPV